MFDPRPLASGTATVTVTAHDDGGTGNGGRDSASATFAITITSPSNAADDSYSTTQATPLHVAAPGVLANDSDPASTSLAAAPSGSFATTAGGMVTLQPNGGFDYTPPSAAAPFTDSFGYQAVDANNQTASANVTIAVTPPPPLVLAPATLPQGPSAPRTPRR